ncbi:hypothetical protein [Neptuniibacter sp. QD37_11]|uniref:hypothetical protein n=1 Tax=Neptuniibacter sp. QD37_11 TaxID=3398209 RepID=UPI0039F5A164
MQIKKLSAGLIAAATLSLSGMASADCAVSSKWAMTEKKPAVYTLETVNLAASFPSTKEVVKGGPKETLHLSQFRMAPVEPNTKSGDHKDIVFNSYNYGVVAIDGDYTAYFLTRKYCGDTEGVISTVCFISENSEAKMDVSGAYKDLSACDIQTPERFTSKDAVKTFYF